MNKIFNTFLLSDLMRGFDTKWERLIAVKARNEEDERLGRLFNILMVLSIWIVILLSIVFLLMQPLGLLTRQVSWIAVAFSLAIFVFSVFCLLQARRGHVRSMIRLYVWGNLIANGAAALIIGGIVSPAWILFFWSVTIAGILLTPVTALWMAGGVVAYYLLMLLMTLSGLYTPPLIPGAAGREFVHMSIVLIMLVFSVGILTYLNMRSLQQAQWNLRERSNQLLEAQAELVRKEKLATLGQVAVSIGHELRNPLGVMNNAVYYLKSVLSDADEDVKEYLNIIKYEVAGSERIVTDLLDSLHANQPQAEIVGVQELLEQTLNNLNIPSSITVKMDIPITLPPLRVDSTQIYQVLRNLISNAIEAMPNGGALVIGAIENKPENTLTISVSDSGAGIPAAQLEKVFQPLFTTKARGIGLGLVAVKNLTQVNGGRVDVQSEVGKGSIFSVTLPAADEMIGVS